MTGVIWSDFNYSSENSIRMRKAKSINGPNFWNEMREVFKYDCAHLPYPRFRLWASVNTVPLVTQYRTSRFIGEAFYHAARDSHIAAALKENWIGIPESLTDTLLVTSDFNTSMQRVQDIAHLLISGITREHIASYRSIIEIGAGYGNMCSVMHSMGFKGEYTIVDIPETQPIQQYYLNRQNIQPKWSFEDDNIEPADLVISTWALSETSLEYRERLIPKIKNSKNWLVLSQAKIFGEEVNFDYFDNLFVDRSAEVIPLVSDGLAAWDGANRYYVVK